MQIIPTVIEKNNEGSTHYDIFSLLLKERIILINGEIDDNMSSVVIAQLLYLDSKENSDIQLYINSPGGSITSGMAIYDTMQYLKSDVSTICVGICASMAAFLLAGGKKNKRYALPNSEIMIHQPLGGCKGQVSDIEITAKRLIDIKQRLNKILADNTNQKIEKINNDTERDYFMNAKEALEYGIIDKIIENKK